MYDWEFEGPEPRLLRWGNEVLEERAWGVMPLALRDTDLTNMWEELRAAQRRRGWRLTKGYEFESFYRSLEEQMKEIPRRPAIDRDAIRSAVPNPDDPEDEESKPKPILRVGRVVKYRRDGLLASEPSRWTRAHLPDIPEYAPPLHRGAHDFGSGELHRMLVGGPIQLPRYPPANTSIIAFERLFDGEAKANHLRLDGRKLFFGADGSLFNEKEEVYVLGARQPMMTVEDICMFINWNMVHWQEGVHENRIGHRIAILKMSNGCDIRADEVIAVNKGFTANRIRRLQRKWRNYFYGQEWE